MIAARQIFLGASQSNAEEEMYKELFFGMIQRSGIVDIESDDVEQVGPSAFASWASNYGSLSTLRSVSFPNCTKVCRDAFNLCLGLQAVNLPKVSVCDSGAFISCEALQSLSLPLLSAINGRITFNCFRMRLLEIPLVTNFGTDKYWLQSIGSRRSDSDTDEYGNVYKALVDVRANTCATIIGHAGFPWSAPTTTKFQCSDGYIIYDTSTSSWKAVTS